MSLDRKKKSFCCCCWRLAQDDVDRAALWCADCVKSQVETGKLNRTGISGIINTYFFKDDQSVSKQF